ncbi:MAG: hypothetical protein ACO323_00040 [Candidatus Kapaibacteriota bacterium]
MRGILIIVVLLIGCASGDHSRYFTIMHHRDSSDIILQQCADSLPYYGFQLQSFTKDTLIATRYIKQGSLNEREIFMTFVHSPGKSECSVSVKTITYFRQDTIIEFYDQQRGFPASYRKDFMPVIQMAERMGKQSLRKKK